MSSEERERPVDEYQAETAEVEGASAEAESVQEVGPSHPIVLYTLARTALLGGTAGLLYLLGARSWFLLVLALFVSGLLSYILLGRLRDAISMRMDRRITAARARREAATRAEDDLY